ncbi:GspE/PulE family protein [Aphanothece sacrum]|uniref:General secretion pathway protein E n=1 Tax=Aphanothece sacrum FPU1 TaxID=1920663 RepID=A0A401ICI4_APHSA|nr:ATPase, T2SS/T4P/T4SS family [Aphanothece sacrum]GBF78946.1 general secretion pathway protein E [Aphanothece sacrum FPU1]GBF86706.1 general secretion pathway protein E [Aphanothece sacrum FPU3]
MVLSNDSSHSLSSFGNQLIQSGYITLPRMQQAWVESHQSGRPLLETLQQITGKPLPSSLLEEYKQQHLFTLKVFHGIEFIDLGSESIDPEQIDYLIKSFIPVDICYRYQLIPLKTAQETTDSLLVAMVNPSHEEAQEKVTEILSSHNMTWQRVGIILEDFEQLIEPYVPEKPVSQKCVERNHDRTIVDLTEVLEDTAPPIPKSSPEELSKLNEAQATPVVTLVNKLLAKAVEGKATAIHLEPEENFLSIRCRQGETLQPLIDPLPKKVAGPIISRLKLMAELDINEDTIAQKGRIRKSGGGRTIYFFVETFPTFYGEKVIVRVLDSAIKPLSLLELMPDVSVRMAFEDMARLCEGLLLVTGATSKNLVSLLYGLLSEQNPQERKIGTVEESLRHILPGINQIEVDSHEPTDYLPILQSFEQEDLDVVMVDSLSDASVVETVVERTSRNCLILASLEASDGASAIAHLSQQVSPALLADSLIGVVHEHTLRRLCPTCRSIYEPSLANLTRFAIPETEKNSIYQARCLNEEAVEQARLKGRLCRQCNGQGYHGYVKLYEVIEITPSLKQAMLSHSRSETGQEVDRETSLQEAILQSHKISPISAGLELVYQGQTSLEELVQFLPNHSQETMVNDDFTLLPVYVTRRLEALEKLLLAVTQEFYQLKEALQPITISNEEKKPIASLLDEPSFEEDKRWEEFDKDFDGTQETITGEFFCYEELSDPGEWDELKRELEPDKETIAINFPQAHISENVDFFNPFNSVPDPW